LQNESDCIGNPEIRAMQTWVGVHGKEFPFIETSESPIGIVALAAPFAARRLTSDKREVLSI